MHDEPSKSFIQAHRLGSQQHAIPEPLKPRSRPMTPLQALGKCVCGFFIMFATMETSFAFR